MKLPLTDRNEAGRVLASELQKYSGRDDVLILALPRGGVPVALEIAVSLNAPMDLMLVRKLGTPGHEETAMGAIASGGIQVLNAELIAYQQISQAAIDKVVDWETKELERRQKAYRGDRPLPAIKNKVVILVDDGVATGATMKAAIKALKQQQPARIVVAVPVAPGDTVAELMTMADEVVCPATPEPFAAISTWYLDFSQLSDEDVRRDLRKAWDS